MNLTKLDLLKIRMIEEQLGMPLCSHSMVHWLNLAETAEHFGETEQMKLFLTAALLMEQYWDLHVFVPMNEKDWRKPNHLIKDPPRRKKKSK